MVASFSTLLFYAPGAFLILAGVLLLSRALTRRTDGATQPASPRWRFLAPLAALVIGSAMIGGGLWTDGHRWSAQNTKYMTYRVSVHVNGSGTVLLFLPAPADSRFWDVLNVTSGSSTLHWAHTVDDTYVALNATQDVAFDVSGAFISPSFNSNLTRVMYVGLAPGSHGPQANATILMSAAGVGTAVALDFEVSLSDSCASHEFLLNGTIRQGSANYLMDTPTAVC